MVFLFASTSAQLQTLADPLCLHLAMVLSDLA